MLNGHGGVYTIIYIIPLINNDVDPDSPLILILKVIIIQRVFIYTQSTIGSGLSSIIAKDQFLRLRR